jgi:hypothetical protein
VLGGAQASARQRSYARSEDVETRASAGEDAKYAGVADSGGYSPTFTPARLLHQRSISLITS